MRKDRIGGAVSRGSHNLIRSRRGQNRFQRGEHVCQCGAVFTGLNLYERHRALARKQERSAA